MSREYDYPADEPTREEMEQAEADRNPPECICENSGAALNNPDCYWHGTGREMQEWIMPLLQNLTDDELVELRAALDAEMSHRDRWAARRFGEDFEPGWFLEGE